MWGLGRDGGKWGRVKDELEHPDLQSRALCSKKGIMPYVRNGTGEWRADGGVGGEGSGGRGEVEVCGSLPQKHCTSSSSRTQLR